MSRYCTISQLNPLTHAKSLYREFSQGNTEKGWTYLPYGPFKSIEAFENWLVAECTDSDPLFYVVIDNKSGEAVDITSYLRINPEIGVIEVGHIHFSPRLQKIPMATEAMYLMMRHAFDEQGYRRYEWKCDNCNEGSKNAALRLGFKFEGVFRQATIYKGRNRDTAWFSILDSEWLQQKAVFECWLHPKNFDNNNVQYRRLKACIE